MRRKQSCWLVLLDLSAVFEPVDHHVLVDCIFKRLGILSWFRSYMSNRCLVVQIDGCVSKIMWLLCDIPQGSVLGPLLFSIDSEPTCGIKCKNGINIHICR